MNSESNTKFIFFNYVILFYLIEILDSSQLSFSSLPATASRKKFDAFQLKSFYEPL